MSMLPLAGDNTMQRRRFLEHQQGHRTLLRLFPALHVAGDNTIQPHCCQEDWQRQNIAGSLPTLRPQGGPTMDKIIFKHLHFYQHSPTALAGLSTLSNT